MGIILFILTILFLVIAHELGHFFMAKKFNIKVLEFGFGIPPRIFGKKFGETLFSLNWLPFGGFVRLLGEDEVNKDILDNERSFAHQKVWKRILVVVAGVVTNLILAWIIFYIVLGAQGFKTQLRLFSPHQFFGVEQQNEYVILIGDIAKNSPADKAGIKVDDRVVAFNDQFVNNPKELINKTKENAGKEVKLTLSDPEKTKYRTVTLVPRIDPPKNEGALGVALASFQIANLEYKTFPEKLFSGITHSYNLTVYSVQILSSFISESFQKHDLAPLSQSVAGPVGITRIINQITQTNHPYLNFLDFLAALSLNLAILNVLPFPGLDGGRLFFLVVEAVTRKRAHATLEKYVHTIGLAVLLALIILITVSDIKKII